MKIKEEFFTRGYFKVGNGMNTRFWEDTWMGDTPLAQEYPMLYNVVHRKQVSVANVLSSSPLNITFRRSLTGNRWGKWLELVNRLMHFSLTNTQDVFVWRLTSTGFFSVKSMYLDLLNNQSRFSSKYIWKIKVPLKIKIFMLLLQRRVILTKDNLAK